ARERDEERRHVYIDARRCRKAERSGTDVTRSPREALILAVEGIDRVVGHDLRKSPRRAGRALRSGRARGTLWALRSADTLRTASARGTLSFQSLQNRGRNLIGVGDEVVLRGKARPSQAEDEGRRCHDHRSAWMLHVLQPPWQPAGPP